MGTYILYTYNFIQPVNLFNNWSALSLVADCLQRKDRSEVKPMLQFGCSTPTLSRSCVWFKGKTVSGLSLGRELITPPLSSLLSGRNTNSQLCETAVRVNEHTDTHREKTIKRKHCISKDICQTQKVRSWSFDTEPQTSMWLRLLKISAGRACLCAAYSRYDTRLICHSFGHILQTSVKGVSIFLCQWRLYLIVLFKKVLKIVLINIRMTNTF